jgi:hypothetical protein
MMIQELVEAVMLEREREAVELERAHKARALRRRTERPRSGPSRDESKRLAVRSFMTRHNPSASVS